MLQQLAWLDNNGVVHKNSESPMLQNLAIGAWIDEDGEYHNVTDLQSLYLSKAEVGQISMGILAGSLKTEDLDDYVTCIQDSEKIMVDVEDAITSFEKKNISGVTQGISDLADALHIIVSAIDTCSQQKDIDQLIKLKKMLASFKNPKSFAYHVGKDLLFNGVNIYHEITSAVTNYRGGKFEAFGEDIGTVLALVLIGNTADKKFQNLDTELDYYHSDGRTDFKGNRNTRTHIKDVSMGAGSNTSFGLMNLADLVKEPEANIVYINLDEEADTCDKMYKAAFQNPLFTKKTKKGIAFRTKLQTKLSACKKMDSLLM